MLLTVVLAIDGISYIRAYLKYVVIFFNVSRTLIVMETVSRLESGCGRDALNVVFIYDSSFHLTDSVYTAAVMKTVKAVNNTVMAYHIIAAGRAVLEIAPAPAHVDSVVSGLFDGIVEYLYSVNVVGGDSGTTAETVNNADIIEHIVGNRIILADTLNALGEFFMVVP